jgi:hypothetical protein
VQDYLGVSYDEVMHLKRTQWLSIPQQKLLAFTSGKVFHDGLGIISYDSLFRVLNGEES